MNLNLSIIYDNVHNIINDFDSLVIGLSIDSLLGPVGPFPSTPAQVQDSGADLRAYYRDQEFKLKLKQLRERQDLYFNYAKALLDKFLSTKTEYLATLSYTTFNRVYSSLLDNLETISKWSFHLEHTSLSPSYYKITEEAQKNTVRLCQIIYSDFNKIIAQYDIDNPPHCLPPLPLP
jgi:hypothetical protein